jgi:hypothetical protein
VACEAPPVFGQASRDRGSAPVLAPSTKPRMRPWWAPCARWGARWESEACGGTKVFLPGWVRQQKIFLFLRPSLRARAAVQRAAHTWAKTPKQATARWRALRRGTERRGGPRANEGPSAPHNTREDKVPLRQGGEQRRLLRRGTCCAHMHAPGAAVTHRVGGRRDGREEGEEHGTHDAQASLLHTRRRGTDELPLRRAAAVATTHTHAAWRSSREVLAA